jgi:hypothetical protein
MIIVTTFSNIISISNNDYILTLFFSCKTGTVLGSFGISFYGKYDGYNNDDNDCK